MTKTSASVKSTNLSKDTLVPGVIHHLLPFCCIIKKRNFHLGLRVASVEIHFIRFDHGVLISVECGLGVQGFILHQHPLGVNLLPFGTGASSTQSSLQEEPVESSGDGWM